MSAKLRALILGQGAVSPWLEQMGGKPRLATDEELREATFQCAAGQWIRVVELYEGNLCDAAIHDDNILMWEELERFPEEDDDAE